MKRFAILILLFSGICFTYAQSDWQQEMQEMKNQLAKDMDQMDKDLFRSKMVMEKDMIVLQKDMAIMHANGSKDMILAQVDAAKDMAMVHADIPNIKVEVRSSDAGYTYSYEINESQQFEGDMFEKLADIKGVEVVYISKSLLGMMPSMNMSGVDIGNIAGRLEGLQVFTAEQKNAIKSLKSETDKLLKKGKYETVMFVKDDDSKTVFYLKKMDNKRSEMLMVTEESREISVIRFVGRFSVRDIQEITKKQSGRK